MEKARDVFSDIDSTCSQDHHSPNARDESHIAMNIVSVKAGEEIELKQSKIRNGVRLYLRPFNVSHGGHPAFGYTIVSKTTTQGLKAEYKGMNGKELGELARSGVDIKETTIIERPEVCYTGDTSADGLMRNDSNVLETSSMEYLRQGFTAPLLLSELTFLDPQDAELAQQRGHLNVKDIGPILNSHGWKPTSDSTGNRQILFYHVSSRHGPAGRLLDTMIKELPSDVVGVAEVAIASFLTPDTSLDVKPNGCISMKDYMNSLKAI